MEIITFTLITLGTIIIMMFSFIIGHAAGYGKAVTDFEKKSKDLLDLLERREASFKKALSKKLDMEV